MSVVNKNLEKMLGKGTEMQLFLTTESVGGNAGYYEESNQCYPCMAANFWYNSQGEIACFSNSKKEGLYSGIFRIAIDKERKISTFKIIESYLDKESPEKAREKLEETYLNYNAFVAIENNSEE